jgi:hypothetical protein
MTRRGPLITLGAVLVLAAIFLWANTLVPKPASTAAAVPAPWTSAGTASQALYAGRSSGDQVTVAIAVNGSKAAAELNAGLAGQVSLQGSANGSQVTLTTRSGTGLDASLSGPDMFGTITGYFGQSFPFSAAPAVTNAVYAGRSSGGQVTLAVVTDGGTAAAYVCNGRTVAAWLQGSVYGNQVNLTGRDGAALAGSLSGLTLTGTITPGTGPSFPFSAELSPRPAGIYQARITVGGLATRIGWVVLPGGTQLGVAVAGATRYAAPALDLSDDGFALHGTSFTASPVAGDQTVAGP